MSDASQYVQTHDQLSLTTGGFDSPTATSKARAVTAGTSKPSSRRAQAGPSRAVGGGTTNPSRRKAINVDGSGDEDIQPPAKKGKVVRSRKPQQRGELAEDESADVIELEGDEIEEIEPAQAKPTTRGGSKKPSPSTATALVNGKGSAANGAMPSGATKGKSKARTKPPSKTHAHSEDEMDVEVGEPAEDQMEGVVEEDKARTNQRTTVRGTKNGRVPPQTSADHEEVARLREQLARVFVSAIVLQLYANIECVS